MWWLFFALLTALLESLKDLVSKRSLTRMDPVLVSWGMLAFALPFLLPVLWWEHTPPTPGFWPPALASAGLNVLAVILYARAIQHADLSLIVPLVAFTPLFLLVTSPLMLGEEPSAAGMVGVVWIVAGSWLLHGDSRRRGGPFAPFLALLREPGARLMVMVALIWGVTANFDKQAMAHAPPLLYAVVIFLLMAALLTLLVARRGLSRLAREVRAHWPTLILLGLLGAGIVIFNMVAVSLTLVPYAIAVKRLSTVMSVIWGGWILKEQEMRRRLAAAALMVIGVAWISLA